MVTKLEILTALRQAGLRNGCQVLLHSSLKSLGQVDGGADTVIDAFLEAVLPLGTLVVPTLTATCEMNASNPPVFDPLTSACWVGKIPETLRARPEAVRSLHPTHSAAAIGPDARLLLDDHVDSITPCDELSPYGKLAASDRGYIVLLGVTHESNTTLHHLEEIAACDYHMQPEPVVSTIVLPSGNIVRTGLLHLWKQPRNFVGIEPMLLERGIQKNVVAGSATIRVIHAKSMTRLVLGALRANPRFLCAD